MSHGRQQIREAVATDLLGTTTCGSRVYESRIYPFDGTPCLAVFSLKEEIMDTGRTLGGVIRRSVSIVVEGRAKPPEGGANLDDLLDTICAEVETKLAEDHLGGLVELVELVQTVIELSAVQERPVGLVRMEWRYIYRTLATAPETILTRTYA
jgi:hypothetical protein